MNNEKKDALDYIVASVIAGVLGALLTGAAWVVLNFLGMTPWIWWQFMLFGAVVLIGIRFSPLWGTTGRADEGSDE